MMENIKLLKKLLKENKETITLEFKREITLSNDKDRMEFAKDISAFANSDGGHIVFGKEDPKQGGKIVGIKKETFSSEQMYQIISNRCTPNIIFKAELLRIGNKWFALLSIPRSSAKPHEIVGTWEVWVRRGDTKSKASEQDRAIMRRETESKEILGEEKEKTSEKYRANALPLAFLILFLMFFLPFRFATFWILGRGLALENWINPENAVFFLLFVSISGICGHFFETIFYDLLLRSVRKLAAPYLLGYLFFVVLVATFNLVIFLYPETIRQFFQTYWLDFLRVCMILVIPLLPAAILLHFPLTEYYSALDNEEYKPNIKAEFRDLLKNIGHCAKMTRKRVPAIIIIATFVFAAIIVPLDLHYNLFTPSYQNNGETFSHAYPYTSDVIYLLMYSTRNSPENVTTESMFYRLAQTQYTIYPAKLPLSNLLSIPNPTNTTTLGTGQPSLPLSDIPNFNLGSVYLSVSKNMSCRFIPENYSFTDIWSNTAGINEPVIANLTYWKVVNPNVTVTTLEPRYSDLGNGTWLESYTYLISNNEKLPMFIDGLEFDRFGYQVVNSTTTKIYVNGNENPAYFVFTNSMLGYILPYYTLNKLNLTVTFQSSDIS
jgi:hypothetical protein